MQTSFLELIPMKPETRKYYEELPSPARAWALAKAAFEVAREANFAEQKAALKAAMTDDPEPPFYDQLPDTATSDQVDAAVDLWKAWHDRNSERIDAATKPIVARYPSELEKLLELAEQNMVDAAEEKLKAKFPDRFASIKPVFDIYRDPERGLYGDKRDQFLKICFNCPDTL